MFKKNYRFYSYLISIFVIPFYIIRNFSIPYHYLRFKNYLNPNYYVTTQIDFGSKKATNFFFYKLSKSQCYLEYGTGNSTLLAKKLDKDFYAIESDTNFFNFLKPNFHKNYILVSLGVVFFFSTPVFSSIRRFYLNKRAIKYASYVFEKIIRDQKQPDLILIDGRYRVLCCLFVYKFLLKNKNDKISIIVDDFLNRRYYQILYKLFDIEIIGRIAHLRFKKTDADIDKLIEKYQYDPR